MPKLTAAQKKQRAIADAVVRRLYTNGFGDRGYRLVLLSGAKDLGGWCEQAVRDIVLDELTRRRRTGQE